MTHYEICELLKSSCRIELLIELEKHELLIKKILNLEHVEIVVIEPEVSELVEDTHTDVRLILKKNTNCI